MGTTNEILKMLKNSGGEALSGEEIAAQLSISRNSVWKAINKLKEIGYEISASTKTGYVLLSDGDVLTSDSVLELVNPSYTNLKIEVIESITSTNTALKLRAEDGEQAGTILIAEEQTKGKGRVGRSFVSPKKCGLYMSMILRPNIPVESALIITTMAAVAVSKAIEEVSDKKAYIKWVNDIYVDKKKVCGILTESSIDFESGMLNYAVLGMGVNIKEPENGYSEELRDIVGALYKENPPMGIRSKLAAAIINNFMKLYENLEDKSFMKEYQDRSLLTGIEIDFVQGTRNFHGRVLGIDKDARIEVRLASGEKRSFSAGEIQINKQFLKQIKETK